jgi:hypothetical protein
MLSWPPPNPDDWGIDGVRGREDRALTQIQALAPEIPG